MKNKSLALQIWMVFAGIIISISILLGLLFPIILRDFFTQEVYETIEVAQNKMLEKKQNKGIFIERNTEEIESKDIRAVMHILYLEDGVSSIAEIKVKKLWNNPKLASGFWNKIQKQAKNQLPMRARYEIQIQDQKIFYLITRFDIKGKKGFLFSYMWDTYRNSLVEKLLKQLMIITVLAVGVSLLIAILFARYLIKPLIWLEKSVKRIAKKDWDTPVKLQRRDEIGRLSKSIEEMRKELIKRDENQQNRLQQISHELKTPVMIIRSYALAVEEEIFPKGDLKSTMKVIEEEAERLEKRIKDLLYLSKLEYMTSHEGPKQVFTMKSLIEEIIEKLRFTREGVYFEMYLEEFSFLGVEEQWRVVIENLLDNQLRYAKKKIYIILQKKAESMLLKVENDGEPIEEGAIEKLFMVFEKGKRGKFGLGLAIVQQIVHFHKGQIWAQNQSEGAAFCIEVPLKEEDNA